GADVVDVVADGQQADPRGELAQGGGELVGRHRHGGQSTTRPARGGGTRAAVLGWAGARGNLHREPRPLAAAVAVAEEAAWVREFVAPWVGRRLRGRSSGDGLAPKRPVPLVLPRG